MAIFSDTLAHYTIKNTSHVTEADREMTATVIYKLFGLICK